MPARHSRTRERRDKIMIQSWTLNSFAAGCILLMVIPMAVAIYRDIIQPHGGDHNDL